MIKIKMKTKYQLIQWMRSRGRNSSLHTTGYVTKQQAKERNKLTVTDKDQDTYFIENNL